MSTHPLQNSSSPIHCIQDEARKVNLGSTVKTYTLSALNPLQQLTYFVLPTISEFFTDGTLMYRNDPTQEGLMPQKSKDKVFHEIETLKEAAGLDKKIHLYTKSNTSFQTIGGSVSLTSPCVTFPLEQFFPHGQACFGDPKRESNLWTFSNDETRFLVTRELGRIKYNTEIIDVVSKSILISLIGFIFLYSSLTIIPCIVISLAAFGAYKLLSREIEWKLDLFAARTLGKLHNDEKKGYQIGVDLFRKMREQNLQRKEAHLLNKIFITSGGNDLRSPSSPSFQGRIQELQRLSLS